MKLKKSLFKYVFPEATVEARLALIRFETELPPQDLVTAIFVLTHDRELEVSDAARDSFWDIPEDTMMEALAEELPLEVLHYIGANFPFTENMVEKIATSDEIDEDTIGEMIGVCTHDGIELFLANKKILGSPDLYRALRGNLNATSDLIIRAEERLVAMDLGAEDYDYHAEDDLLEALIGESVDLAEELIEESDYLDEELIEDVDDLDEQLIEEIDDPDEGLLDEELIEEIDGPDEELIEEVGDLDEELSEDGGDLDKELTEESGDDYNDDEEVSGGVYQMIQNMTVGDKIKLALTGNKEVRGVLLKQSNKVVSRSVVRNPKITNDEIAQLTQTRSVSDEILREIARNDEWLKNYGIRRGLAFNPKTPVQISLKLITKLNVKDLVALSNSKGVPNVIAASAKKIVNRKKK